MEEPGGAGEEDFPPGRQAGPAERIQMGMVFDPERNALAVLGEEGLFAGSEPQQRAQPGLPAADDVEHALADAVVAGSRRKREVLLQFRLQPGEVTAKGAFVDRGVHGTSWDPGRVIGACPQHAVQHADCHNPIPVLGRPAPCRGTAQYDKAISIREYITMKARILVVDDDEALAEMIGIVLRNDGFEPVFCADGGKALEVFRSSNRISCCWT